MKSFFKYVTASEEDADWGFYLTVAGSSQIPPGTPYPYFKHPSDYHFTWDKGRVLHEYQINYITRGSGILETKHGKYKITPGTVFITFPKEWHRYKPDEKTGWDEYYIGFNGRMIKNLVRPPFFSPEASIYNFGHNEELLDLIQKINRWVEDEYSGFHQRISGAVMSILGLMVSHEKNKNFTGKEIEKTIQKARFFLRQNVEKQVDMRLLADDLNVGYSYFRRMFKNYTGISPGQYHLQLRIQRSKELIISTDYSIKQVAYTLGFDSIYYFSRLFKEKTKMTPVEYRNKNKKRAEN